MSPQTSQGSGEVGNIRDFLEIYKQKLQSQKRNIVKCQVAF